jgi:hypothetical protein
VKKMPSNMNTGEFHDTFKAETVVDFVLAIKTLPTPTALRLRMQDPAARSPPTTRMPANPRSSRENGYRTAARLSQQSDWPRPRPTPTPKPKNLLLPAEQTKLRPKAAKALLLRRSPPPRPPPHPPATPPPATRTTGPTRRR